MSLNSQTCNVRERWCHTTEAFCDNGQLCCVVLKAIRHQSWWNIQSWKGPMCSQNRQSYTANNTTSTTCARDAGLHNIWIFPRPECSRKQTELRNAETAKVVWLVLFHTHPLSLNKPQKNVLRKNTQIYVFPDQNCVANHFNRVPQVIYFFLLNTL